MGDGWINGDFELLTEDDIPGASLKGRKSSEVKSLGPNWWKETRAYRKQNINSLCLKYITYEYN